MMMIQPNQAFRITDGIMERGGFEPTDTGPYVSELWLRTREQVMYEGLINRHFGPGATDSEIRAKALLALDWEQQHRHLCRIECIDGPPWEWTHDLWMKRTSFRIEWRMILPWIGDQCRRGGVQWRRWRDRRLVNPYR